MESDILKKFGQIIFEYFLNETSPGDTFLLALDPTTFQSLKDRTGEPRIDKALLSTGSLYDIPTNDFIAISVATLQVSLIYNVERNDINDSFYELIKNYYPCFTENSEILRYFRCFQEGLWEKVKKAFRKKERYIDIPPKKTGSGRYVQYPKSQRVITWTDILKCIDHFIKIRLEPYLLLSFEDFCDRVFPYYNFYLPEDEEIIAKRIIFSFYGNWDGRSSDEIKAKKQCPKTFPNERIIHPNDEEELTARIFNQKIHFYKGKNEVSISRNHDILFNGSDRVAFIEDDKYEDWVYTKKTLRQNDRVLLLVKKSVHFNKTKFSNDEKVELTTDSFFVYIFDKCNNDIANFIRLSFIPENIYIIVGGIKGQNNHRHRGDFIGSWYEFALPKIYINTRMKKNKPNMRVFIDSKEILVEKDHIDLVNLTQQDTKEKMILNPGQHSIKCPDTPTAFFEIEGFTINNVDKNFVSGWKMSEGVLYPANSTKDIDVQGLIFRYMANENKNMRPFLSKLHTLEDRFIYNKMNRKIRNLEKRKLYVR